MAGRPPGKTTTITPAQREALDVIRAFSREMGYGPSRAELGERLGIRSSSAHHLVAELDRKGYLRRERETARGLSVVRPADPPPGTKVSIPLLGVVAAGRPIFAEENVVDRVTVDSESASRGRCFALRVEGESMVNAGIRTGDLVVVRQQPVAAPGDIVVALVCGEATIKTLFMDEEVIELRAENPEFPPIAVAPDDELRIVGKVVSVIHPHPRGQSAR